MECGGVRSTAGRQDITNGWQGHSPARNDNPLYHSFCICQVVYGKWFVFWEIEERRGRRTEHAGPKKSPQSPVALRGCGELRYELRGRKGA
jgi:hypothetical protein